MPAKGRKATSVTETQPLSSRRSTRKTRIVIDYKLPDDTEATATGAEPSKRKSHADQDIAHRVDYGLLMCSAALQRASSRLGKSALSAAPASPGESPEGQPLAHTKGKARKGATSDSTPSFNREGALYQTAEDRTLSHASGRPITGETSASFDHPAAGVPPQGGVYEGHHREEASSSRAQAIAHASLERESDGVRQRARAQGGRKDSSRTPALAQNSVENKPIKKTPTGTQPRTRPKALVLANSPEREAGSPVVCQDRRKRARDGDRDHLDLPAPKRSSAVKATKSGSVAPDLVNDVGLLVAGEAKSSTKPKANKKRSAVVSSAQPVPARLGSSEDASGELENPLENPTSPLRLTDSRVVVRPKRLGASAKPISARIKALNRSTVPRKGKAVSARAPSLKPTAFNAASGVKKPKRARQLKLAPEDSAVFVRQQQLEEDQVMDVLDVSTIS